MSVGELIRLLGKYPVDMRVVVDGYEEGYDDDGVVEALIFRCLSN